MAVDAKTLDDISEKIAAGIKMLGGVKMGAEAQVQSVVESALAHFDVVTHERMEVQEAMLNKARQDLAAMEARIVKLEAMLKTG
ncbi:MAG: accessory factor UbiK family protein [Mariprofundaceae bacterium]|nr:accessory factor UbiK family protein [Mariprofundaceae bacterium]